MKSLKMATNVLIRERDELQSQVDKLNSALATLGNSSDGRRRGHRRMSRATRKKMAVAARERWKKIHAANKS